MTRKDYDLIAACIGAAYADSRNDHKTVEDVGHRLINELSLDNPRFDSLRFKTRVEYWKHSHMLENA